MIANVYNTNANEKPFAVLSLTKELVKAGVPADDISMFCLKLNEEIEPSEDNQWMIIGNKEVIKKIEREFFKKSRDYFQGKRRMGNSQEVSRNMRFALHQLAYKIEFDAPKRDSYIKEYRILT
mgnify:CR=1 FL=1